MKNKVILIVSVLFGLMMINSGLNKFFGYMPMPEMPTEATNLMMAFVASNWLMPLLAISEIIGGVLIMIPRTRALGTIVLLPVVVGILLFHIAQEPSGTPVGVILLLISAWFIYEDRDKYLPMVS